MCPTFLEAPSFQGGANRIAMKKVKSTVKMRCDGSANTGLRPGLALWLAWILVSMLVAACGTAAPAPTSTPAASIVTGTPAPAPTGTIAPAPTGTIAPTQTGTVEPAPDGTTPPEAAPAVDGEIPGVEDVATAVSARTPVPTPTAGAVAREIEEFTTEAGLAGKTFLGLAVEDWLNLAFSGLFIIVGYFVIKFLFAVLTRIAKRTAPQADDKIVALIARYANWLLLLWVIHYAEWRLDFLSEGLRTNLRDLSILLTLVIVTIFALDMIGFVGQSYRDKLESRSDERRLTPVIITVQRLAQSLVVIVALSIMLVHMGFDISIIAALLIVSGLIISFGAQDILTDFLSGFIILIDQPFRVGDSILVKDLNTRGTVLEIGPRSTQIRTGDNREVIVPNSRIGQSQVINYTFPDSRFRAQTDIGVAYGTHPEKMRKVIDQAVRGVEGVLPDKPVDIFFLKFGDSSRLVRVRWWIDTYRHEKHMLDKVNTALELALDKAGIDLPFNTYDLRVRMDDVDSIHPEQGIHQQRGS
jgi:small-conductance mechanosensitive channel